MSLVQPIPNRGNSPIKLPNLESLLLQRWAPADFLSTRQICVPDDANQWPFATCKASAGRSEVPLANPGRLSGDHYIRAWSTRHEIRAPLGQTIIEMLPREKGWAFFKKKKTKEDGQFLIILPKF